MFKAQGHRFIDQLFDIGQADGPPRRIGAGFRHAIGTTQVAIVVGVNPQLPLQGGVRWWDGKWHAGSPRFGELDYKLQYTPQPAQAVGGWSLKSRSRHV